MKIGSHRIGSIDLDQIVLLEKLKLEIPSFIFVPPPNAQDCYDPQSSLKVH